MSLSPKKVSGINVETLAKTRGLQRVRDLHVGLPAKKGRIIRGTQNRTRIKLIRPHQISSISFHAATHATSEMAGNGYCST